MKNKITSSLFAVVLVALLGLLHDPFMYWMPTAAQTLVLTCAVVLAIMWGVFVLREESRDEREAMLRMRAGRLAYLSGIGVLTLALAVQGIMHQIDPWVTIALGVMVVTKIFGRSE